MSRVIRYLAGTQKLQLIYKCNSESHALELECYSDADFAGCPTTLHSTSGAVIKYANAAISWFSRRQELVADSTCESEIVAANAASKEVIWTSRLFKELINLDKTPSLYIDNEAAKRISENTELHSRSKHIQRKHLFIRDRIKNKMLTVNRIDTKNNLADIFTKSLPRKRLVVLCKNLGLV